MGHIHVLMSEYGIVFALTDWLYANISAEGYIAEPRTFSWGRLIYCFSLVLD